MRRAILLATFLALAAVAGSAAEASRPGAGARIAYERSAPGALTSEIFAAGPGGRGGALIAAPRGGDLPTAPSFSADGSKLVFARESRLGFGSVVVANADGSAPRVVAGDGHRPSISPDGTRIALDSGGSVWLERVDGSRRMRLASGEDPSWSPDGRSIAFVNGGDVYVTSLTGSRTRRLTRDGANAGPGWSPDGAEIAFWHAGPRSTIETVGSNARGRRTLGAGMEPAWSPDGATIAFTCPLGVCTMKPDGSGRRLLIAGGYRPAWQPLRRA
jgi:Tol biopolymer transport system component